MTFRVKQLSLFTVRRLTPATTIYVFLFPSSFQVLKHPEKIVPEFNGSSCLTWSCSKPLESLTSSQKLTTVYMYSYPMFVFIMISRNYGRALDILVPVKADSAVAQ
jgi:hypothetical protein